MALRQPGESSKTAQPGDTLLVVHEFNARSVDELGLAKGDRIELIERDDDFGDGWYLGRHTVTGNTGLFPEVYTTPAVKSPPVVANSAGGPQSPTKFSPTATSFTNKSPGATEPKLQSPTKATMSSPVELAPVALPTIPQSPTEDTPNVLFAQTSPATPSHHTSAVMNETLSVIDEHITNMSNPSPMSTPNQTNRERRTSNDSGSQYGGLAPPTRLENINGGDTDDEEVLLNPEEVTTWSPAKVADYLHKQGVEKAHCDKFLEEEFTGEVLLRMEQSQIFMKEFDLGPIGRRMRTWQKIKSLQDEVRAAGTASVPNAIPHRESLVGTGSLSSSRQSSPRPSAASVRSIGHQRNSSTEQTLAVSSRVSRGAPSPRDRASTITGPPSSTSGGAARLSSHRPSLSADQQNLANVSRSTSQLSLGTPDIDRGYVSGGDDSKASRKVLKKREATGDHQRNSSYGSEKRRSANFFRLGKKESPHLKSLSQDNLAMLNTEGIRVVSEPTQISGTSPTVTRLEYDTPSPRSNRISVPKMSSSTVEPARANTSASDSKGVTTRRGLRAVSDAVTGREKSLVLSTVAGDNNKILPDDSAMTQSPETASAGPTPVLDPDQGGATPAARRKPKKQTSAYIKGLEKKSPQEQMQGCDYSGWMKKKSSNLMTTWKPRLFVLRGRRLSYYYSESDTEEKGLIDISSHRVLPADHDFLTNMHAMLTGAASPVGQDGASANTSQTFIFKLVPPRSGLSKGVNFTKPAVHYFAVPSLQEGRVWMAALMKATIDRDENTKVVTTYQQKTITLEEARLRKERPPFLQGAKEEDDTVSGVKEKVDDPPPPPTATSTATATSTTTSTNDAPFFESSINNFDTTEISADQVQAVEGEKDASEAPLTAPLPQPEVKTQEAAQDATQEETIQATASLEPYQTPPEKSQAESGLGIQGVPTEKATSTSTSAPGATGIQSSLKDLWS